MQIVGQIALPGFDDHRGGGGKFRGAVLLELIAGGVGNGRPVQPVAAQLVGVGGQRVQFRGRQVFPGGRWPAVPGEMAGIGHPYQGDLLHRQQAVQPLQGLLPEVIEPLGLPQQGTAAHPGQPAVQKQAGFEALGSVTVIPWGRQGTPGTRGTDGHG